MTEVLSPEKYEDLMRLLRSRRKERDLRRELGLEDDEYYGLPCDTEKPYNG